MAQRNCGGNAHKEFCNNNVARLCDLENGTEHPTRLSRFDSCCLEEIKASSSLGRLIGSILILDMFCHVFNSIEINIFST